MLGTVFAIILVLIIIFAPILAIWYVTPNLRSFLWNPAKHMREMNMWRNPPRSTTTILLEKFQVADKIMAANQVGDWELVKWHRAKYDALSEELEASKKAYYV